LLSGKIDSSKERPDRDNNINHDRYDSFTHIYERMLPTICVLTFILGYCFSDEVIKVMEWVRKLFTEHGLACISHTPELDKVKT
jgi:hypothetical protein